MSIRKIKKNIKKIKNSIKTYKSRIGNKRYSNWKAIPYIIEKLELELQTFEIQEYKINSISGKNERNKKNNYLKKTHKMRISVDDTTKGLFGVGNMSKNSSDGFIIYPGVNNPTPKKITDGSTIEYNIGNKAYPKCFNYLLTTFDDFLFWSKKLFWEEMEI